MTSRADPAADLPEPPASLRPNDEPGETDGPAASDTAEPTAADADEAPAHAAVPARADWFRRHLLIASAAGLGLGGIGQLTVFVTARGAADATLLQRLSALLTSTAAWLVLAFAAAWLGHRALAQPRSRRVAIGLSSLVLGSLAAVMVCGVGLRVMSGSYLSAGALVFLANSSEHFLHGAIGDYAGTALSIVVVVIVCIGTAAGLLRSSAVAPSRPTRRQGGFMALLLAALVGLFIARASVRFVRGMFMAGPLLALVGSFDEDYELRRASIRPDSLGEALAPAGPPLTAQGPWESALAPTNRPNVLLIMLESVTPRHMSGFGYERNTTPQLDQLAREGLSWKRAWTTATHSNYAQMAVLSSLFPRRGYGLDQYTHLDYPRLLWHDAFYKLHYPTATVSSQDENWQGMLRFQQTGTPTFFWFSDNYQGTHLDSGIEKIVPDDETVSVALDWLKKEAKPWALYINLQATHFPYTISPKAKRPYQPDEPTWSTFNYLGFPEAEKQIAINRYDNALHHVDEQVGRIRSYLDDTGQLEDTLWIVTSDHGEMFFEKELVTHGKTLYQLEAHVPLMMHWPKVIAPETRDEPVSNLDVLPTAFDYLGLPPHPSWQGRSLREAQGAGARPAIFLNIQGLRTADAVVCWPYKLILDRSSGKAQLFQLQADPYETKNLINDLPEISARLNDTLSKQLIAQMDYYGDATEERRQRFQPRLRGCPRLD